MELLQMCNQWMIFWSSFFIEDKEEPVINTEAEIKMAKIREDLWDYYGKTPIEMENLRSQLRKLRE